MGMGRWLSAIGVISLLAACSLTTQSHAGEACAKPSDCDSDTCNQGTCAGKTCGTNGPEPDNCEPGWSCVHFDKSCALINVICSDAAYRCIVMCGKDNKGCPGGTYCPAGNTDPTTECQFGKAPDTPLPTQPTVSIIAQKTAKVGEAVPFSAPIVFTEDETIVSTTWDFGDNVPTDQNTGQNPTHEFNQAGTFTVKVSVVDNYSRTSTATQAIEIDSP